MVFSHHDELFPPFHDGLLIAVEVNLILPQIPKWNSSRTRRFQYSVIVYGI
jgi:hypothetical protein